MRQDQNGKLVKKIERYDHESGIWSEVAALKTSRILFASCYFGDSLWILGGIKSSKDGPLSLVESWNFRNWKIEPPLQSPVMKSTAIAHQNVLYNVGGEERTDGQFQSRDQNLNL